MFCSNFQVEVVRDFREVAGVLIDFANIFGPELKAIVNDPAQIDSVVRRVENLVEPIEQADFCIFSSSSKENWVATLQEFYNKVKLIHNNFMQFLYSLKYTKNLFQVKILEREAKGFIDDSFKSLRSSEVALSTLLKFRKIQTRPAIQKRLLIKFELVIGQFLKEVNFILNCICTIISYFSHEFNL